MANMEQDELTVRELLETAQAAPGVQDLIRLYSYYRILETTTEPMRRAMQIRSISSVSNGTYPVLSR